MGRPEPQRDRPWMPCVLCAVYGTTARLTLFSPDTSDYYFVSAVTCLRSTTIVRSARISELMKSVPLKPLVMTVRFDRRGGAYCRAHALP